MSKDRVQNASVELTITVEARDAALVEAVAAHLQDIRFRRDIERLLSSTEVSKNKEEIPTSEALAPY